MDKNTAKIHAEINLENMNLVVSVYDIIEQMSDEAKEELGRQLAWSMPVADELKRSCVEGYAYENYNPDVHKIRTGILTSEDAPEMIRKWAGALVHEAKTAKAEQKRFEDAYYKLYHAVRGYFGVLSVPETIRLVGPAKFECQRETREEIDAVMAELESEER